MEWWKDLCEYYKVDKETAIQLGVRKTGRKPNFPSSPTCPAVGGKNMEEFWDSKPRNTIQQKMDFYKDIGAWSVFRQCNYRSNFNYGRYFGNNLKDGASVVEYGCGVAPFVNWLIENDARIDLSTCKFSLVDVASETLEFAKWRLNKKRPDLQFDFHEITEKYAVPKFTQNFDIICIMDVFEHLPNPYDVVDNLISHSNKNCIMVETWVDKTGGKAGGPDLEESDNERPQTEALLNSKYPIAKGGSIRARVFGG